MVRLVIAKTYREGVYNCAANSEDPNKVTIVFTTDRQSLEQLRGRVFPKTKIRYVDGWAEGQYSYEIRRMLKTT